MFDPKTQRAFANLLGIALLIVIILLMFGVIPVGMTEDCSYPC